MIFCENISKSFGEQAVLHNFTYNFNTTGLYVLLGESGSGKTTLLNIALLQIVRTAQKAPIWQKY